MLALGARKSNLDMHRMFSPRSKVGQRIRTAEDFGSLPCHPPLTRIRCKYSSNLIGVFRFKLIEELLVGGCENFPPCLELAFGRKNTNTLW